MDTGIVAKVLLWALLAVNLTTFLFFAADKVKARKGAWRIPEKTLMALAACGGALGAFLGMKVFHHKTLHKKFSIGVPLLLLAQILVALAVAGRVLGLY